MAYHLELLIITNQGYKAQQTYYLQCINEAAFTVNATLKMLASKIINLHYMWHSKFGSANVENFEGSAAHCLIARDGLHLSYKGIYYW